MDPKQDGVTLELDPKWGDRYESEQSRVREASNGGLLDVFHIGSTAIPGVPGKPVLDVVPVYADYEAMCAAADHLVENEFELEHDADDMTVVLRREEEYVVAVRMYTVDADQWRPMLIFREYLAENPEARKEYARVIGSCVSVFQVDRTRSCGRSCNDLRTTLSSVTQPTSIPTTWRRIHGRRPK